MSLIDMARVRRSLAAADNVVMSGRVTRASGILVEAALPHVTVGTACEIRPPNCAPILAEVVGFSGSQALLMPFAEVKGIGIRYRVFLGEFGTRGEAEKAAQQYRANRVIDSYIVGKAAP